MNDPINPGEGWRILKPGEQRQNGDEEAFAEHGWVPIENTGANVWLAIVRRRIVKTQEQEDEEAYEIWNRSSHPGPIGRQCWFAALAYARKEAK